MNFIGQIPVRFDSKNRVFLPAQFRRELQPADGQTLVVRKDYFEDCLVIYPEQVWQAEIAGVRSRLNRFDGNQQMLYRKMVSEAQPVQIDSSGRILLPRPMLDKVGIGQDAVFVGMQQTIELWAQDKVSMEGGDSFMSDEEFVKGIQACMSGNEE